MIGLYPELFAGNIFSRCGDTGYYETVGLLIVPINRGGAKLDMANLQSLCYPCHNRVGHRIAHEITNTWLPMI